MCQMKRAALPPRRCPPREPQTPQGGLLEEGGGKVRTSEKTVVVRLKESSPVRGELPLGLTAPPKKLGRPGEYKPGRKSSAWAIMMPAPVRGNPFIIGACKHCRASQAASPARKPAASEPDSQESTGATTL